MSIIDKYVKMGFSNWQLEEIKLAYKNGLTEEVVDKYLCDTILDSFQLKEIRLGLENGIDVEWYAKADMPYEQMKEVRERLEKEKLKAEEEKALAEKEQIKEKKKEIRKEKASKRTSGLTVFIMLCVLAVLIAIIYFVYPIYQMMTKEVILDLKTSEITLEVFDKFIAEDYILETNEDERLIKNYPTFNADTLGDFNVTYQAYFSGGQAKSVDLTIHVVDTQSPVITLTDESIKLTRDTDTFDPKEYIETLSDNYDTELEFETDELDWKQNEQEIVYYVEDSSGNKATATLSVTIKDKPVVKKPQTKPTSDNGSSGNDGNSGSSNTGGDNSGGGDNGGGGTTPKPQNTPFLKGVHDVSCSVGTSINDVIFQLQSGVSSSSGYTLDIAQVNTSCPGNYTVYFYSNDGITKSCTVHVS